MTVLQWQQENHVIGRLIHLINRHTVSGYVGNTSFDQCLVNTESFWFNCQICQVDFGFIYEKD